MFKRVLILNSVLIGALLVLPEGSSGKTVIQIFPKSHEISKRSAVPRSTSNLDGTYQQTGSVSGFVNSTAEGTGEPGSATAYAWQGGQTSAHGTQTATADQNGNLNSQTSGSSTCQQGYQGTGSGNNANSVGSALCNATNSQSGTHETNEKSKGESDTKFGWMPMQPMPVMQPMQFPTPIHMNYSVGMIGEAQSGQTHNSASSVGGEAGGMMNIFAGGYAGAPQGSMTFSLSAFDPHGNAINANQTLQTSLGLNSEEHTIVDLSGTMFDHDSGGLSHVQGVGETSNSSYNNHSENKKNRVVETKLM